MRGTSPQKLTTMSRKNRKTLLRKPASAVPQAPLAEVDTKPSSHIQLNQAFGWKESRFNSVAWSPDGNYVAAASDDTCIYIWNTTTYKREHLLEGHQASVQSVAWSPDSRCLASGADDTTVRVWEAGSGRALRTLAGHQRLVRSVAWSPDGQLLATGSTDKTVRVWEASSGQALRTLAGHQHSVQSVAWSPDGRCLASDSADKTVRIWEASSGRVLHTLQGRQHWIQNVAWSCDNRFLASASSNTTVQVWEASSGRPLRTLKGHQDLVLSVAWSPNNRFLASGSADKTVRIWEASSGQALRTLKGHEHSVWSVAWSLNNRLLASASHDKTVRIWEASSSQALRTLKGHQDLVLSVAWSPDGRLLASASQHGETILWTCQSWQPIKRGKLPAPKHFLLSIAFIPTQPMAARFGNTDIVVQAWRIAGGPEQTDVQAVSTPAVTSTSAKIVFVGKSDVGKSCLALRLAENRFERQGSTLGMKLWTLRPEQLDPHSVTPPGEKRDVTLWDLGGQDEYRLVHQLFLHDTTLALVLFDPTRGRAEFEEVEEWNLRLEKQLRGRKATKLLVGTKKDQAAAPVNQAEIRRLITSCDFDGYFFTSASTDNDDGTAELCAAIAQAIDWDTLTKTTRLALFQRIYDEIEARRAHNEVVLLYEDLEKQLQQDTPALYEAGAVAAVIESLARQGVITQTQLASSERVLVLQIAVIERYAGSLIVAARDHPRGVPALEEREVTAGRFVLPGIKPEDRLHPFQERIVLESVMQLLLERGICFRHEGLLIFPTLFPGVQAREAAKSGESIPLYYDFSGPIDNIYSALVVTLALSERFGRVRLWADGAEYEHSGQGVCGLKKVSNHRGIAHVDLYFSTETPTELRNLFIVFIEDHLRNEGVSITEGLQLRCTACGYRFEEALLGEHLAAGLREIACPRPSCKTANLITAKAADLRAQHPEVEQEFLALKTIVERRSEQNVSEFKRAAAETATTPVSTDPIRILHLSDLHFADSDDPLVRLQPLLADLRDKEGGFGFEQLDYLVLSGDLTNRASPEEFERVYQLISEVIERFKLSANRCLIVPGNHDLSWDEQVYRWRQARLVDLKSTPADALVPLGHGYLERDDDLYPQRFREFGKLYHNLVQQPYPPNAEGQGLSFLFPDTRLQFLTFNSSWEIDEFHQTRSSLNESAVVAALLKADEQLQQAGKAEQLDKNAKVLRLAVWHHPVTGNEKIVNDDFLERLQKAEVQLCLHGHVHQQRTDIIGYVQPRKIHVIGTGSFGAVAKHRPESTPRLYNLIEIARDHSWVKVHTRHMRKDGGAWEGWAVWPSPDRDSKRTYYEIDLKKKL